MNEPFDIEKVKFTRERQGNIARYLMTGVDQRERYWRNTNQFNALEAAFVSDRNKLARQYIASNARLDRIIAAYEKKAAK